MKVTVEALICELRRFEDRYSDYNIACDMPDGTRCCMVGIYTDDSGSLNLLMEEEIDGGGYYDVSDMLSCLDSYSKSMEVHIEACGMLLDFETYKDGTVFVPDEDRDAICCDCKAIVNDEEDAFLSGIDELDFEMFEDTDPDGDANLEKGFGTIEMDQIRNLECIIADCETLMDCLQRKMDNMKEILRSL